MEPVLTHRAKTVVDAARLHRARERRDRGLTLVEGPHLLADVRASGANIRDVFSLDGANGSIAVDQKALQRLAGTETPRGPIAVVEVPVEWLDRSHNVVVAVGVSDPGNVGTIIRTAAAFGWGFAYMPGTADPWAPKTIRAGAAGQFQTPIAKVGSLADLSGWVTVATVVGGGVEATEIEERPVALLIGEEAAGLEEWMSDSARYRLTIPTPGPTESLNAAVAAGIAIYELSKGSGESASDV